MPEILKHPDGSTNWTAIFTGFGAMVILVLQQWQTYRIAEIKTQGEINAVHFMNKEDVINIERDLNDRLSTIEAKFIDRDLILRKFDEYDKRLLYLEHKDINTTK